MKDEPYGMNCFSLPNLDQKQNSHKKRSTKKDLSKWWPMEGFQLHVPLLFQDIPEDAPSPNGLEQLKVSPQIALKMLRAFLKGSAAGPTGSSATHILHAVQVNNQTLALDIFTDFVNLLASGLAPPKVQTFSAGAHLIGLSEKDGGIRPIAIGDVYRRLTGKCLSSLVKEEANCFFLPAQCACAPGGGEAVVHAWRHLMEEFKNNPEFIGMKIDFVNAFNSVKRIVLLNECFEKFPHIYKWVHFCYSQHSHLFFGDYIISSQAGVQQGDPLGPLLFCLVLHVLVSKLLNESPGSWKLIWENRRRFKSLEIDQRIGS